MEYKYLNDINSPVDLKRLPLEALPELCSEIRHFILEVLSVTPGHLGSSLGVVELTVALHYVLNTPHDRIVWDVGHQAYAHKIITGRRDSFHTLRSFGGISGFPSIFESEYDSFGAGHASTSISAALGMAIAARLKNERREVVAVIGDGALSGGLAFEGLNNASTNPNDMLVVLNDNNMAIDPIRGGLNSYLTRVHFSARYNRFRYRVGKLLRRMGMTSDRKNRAIRFTNSLKGLRVKSETNIFEGLNLRYFGPVDGHDVLQLVQIISEIKNYKGPKVLHIITQKGKGYAPAEHNVSTFHAPGKFDVGTGEIIKGNGTPEPPKFQDVFGKTLLELARKNPKIVGVTPAMASGCSMTFMMNEMPERTFDVGIAEGHAVTFSAGLAREGMIPFCNIYSSFAQRAYDNFIHDVALQRMHVVLCLDRAGLVGNDGATHQGQFDLAMMRCVPNVTIAVPRDEHILRDMMLTAEAADGPWVIRYPRGKGVFVGEQRAMQVLPVGRGVELCAGERVAVVGVGPVLYKALTAIEELAKEGYNIGLYDLTFVKPLDEDLLEKVAQTYQACLLIEDGCAAGGAGSAVEEWMVEHNKTIMLRRAALPDRFIEHGSPDELYRSLDLDVQGIIKRLRELL